MRPQGKARVNPTDFVDAMRRTQLISDSRHKIRASRQARPMSSTLTPCGLPESGAKTTDTVIPSKTVQPTRNRSSIVATGEYLCSAKKNLDGSPAPDAMATTPRGRRHSPVALRRTDPLLADPRVNVEVLPIFNLHRRHFTPPPKPTSSSSVGASSTSARKASGDDGICRGRRRAQSESFESHLDLLGLIPMPTNSRRSSTPDPLPEKKLHPGKRWVSGAPRDTRDIIGMGYDSPKGVDPFANQRLRSVPAPVPQEARPQGRRLLCPPGSINIGMSTNSDQQQQQQAAPSSSSNAGTAAGTRRAFTPQPRRESPVSWQQQQSSPRPAAGKENNVQGGAAGQSSKQQQAGRHVGVGNRKTSASPVRGRSNLCSEPNILGWA